MMTMIQMMRLRWLSLLLVLCSLRLTSTSNSAFEVCEDSLIWVHNVTISCDSPYTYYYGNGAHRNSETCDYGDKASISVYLEVLEDLSDIGQLYMALGVYTPDASEQLYMCPLADLCELVDDEACNAPGVYLMQRKVQFGYFDSEAFEDFYPLVEIGFSDSEDEGVYDLGGLNIQCNEDGEDGDGDYSSWNSNTTLATYKEGGFAANYGILIGTIMLVSVFAFLLFRGDNGEEVVEGGGDPSKGDPTDYELQKGG